MTTKEVCLEYIEKEIESLENRMNTITIKSLIGDWSKENKVAQLSDVIRASIQTIEYWERSMPE